MNCDNKLTTYKKEFTGDWEMVEEVPHWTDRYDFTFPVRKSTKMKFVCQDVGVVGGFISSIHYPAVEGKIFSTTKPMTNSFFKITQGNTNDLVYTTLGAGRWGKRIDLFDYGSDAFWVCCTVFCICTLFVYWKWFKLKRFGREM